MSNKITELKLEQECLDFLAKAVGVYRKLSHTHPSHEKDFVDGIHKCQTILMWKRSQRDYPKEFPTYEKR